MEGNEFGYLESLKAESRFLITILIFFTTGVNLFLTKMDYPKEEIRIDILRVSIVFIVLYIFWHIYLAAQNEEHISKAQFERCKRFILASLLTVTILSMVFAMASYILSAGTVSGTSFLIYYLPTPIILWMAGMLRILIPGYITHLFDRIEDRLTR